MSFFLFRALQYQFQPVIKNPPFRGGFYFLSIIFFAFKPLGGEVPQESPLVIRRRDHICHFFLEVSNHLFCLLPFYFCLNYHHHHQYLRVSCSSQIPYALFPFPFCTALFRAQLPSSLLPYLSLFFR